MTSWAWKWVAVAVVVVVAVGVWTVQAATTISSLGLLDDLLSTDPTLLCHYVSCQEPVSADACPDGTVYIDGVAQFGCCGACVTFRKDQERCEGDFTDVFTTVSSRGSLPQPLDPAFLASLRSVQDNVVESHYCAEGYQCFNRKCWEDPAAGSCREMLFNYLDNLKNGNYVHYRDDYRWRPSCTVDGKFTPKQCLGPLTRQRCVCMDPEGNRLYGLAFPEQEELFNTMNCKCSRQAWEKKQAGVASVTLHCLENGNFERLQCEDGWCYCIDPETAVAYGTRLPEDGMHLLPCYNKTTTGERYLRRCESQQHAHDTFMKALEETGVRGPESLTTCDQDGSYSGKQCDPELCRCYDKYKVEALSYPSGDDCQCARDKRYYQDMSGYMSVLCTVNTGAYEEQQKTIEYKYCVDEDGIRAGPLVLNQNDYYLSCYDATMCMKEGNGPDVVNEYYDYCAMACVDWRGDACPAEAYANYQP